MQRSLCAIAIAIALGTPSASHAQSGDRESIDNWCAKPGLASKHTDQAPLVDFRGESLKLLDRAVPALGKLRDTAPKEPFDRKLLESVAGDVCELRGRWKYDDERRNPVIADQIGCVSALSAVTGQVLEGYKSEFRDLSTQGRHKLATSLSERFEMCRRGGKPL
jgi:hypothetical protein